MAQFAELVTYREIIVRMFATRNNIDVKLSVTPADGSDYDGT